MNMHPRSNSQAGQESFVLELTRNKFNGAYIEIGAGHPIVDSNTYILETEFSWRGISLEIDEIKSNYFNQVRGNKCIKADATIYNWVVYLKQVNWPSNFDYLQLDIEPAKNTFKAMINFPLKKYKPSIITFEHDKYTGSFNWLFQIFGFIYLTLNGYKRVSKDVTPFEHKNRIFEDWYVRKSFLKSGFNSSMS